MRKFVLLVTLLASVLFTVGATASPALASNCTAGQGATYWNGNLNFQGALSSCTGVDQIEMYTGAINGFSQPSFSGWQDNTTGVDWQSAGPVDIQFGRVGVLLSSASYVFSHYAWCGGAAHVVHTQFQYRIHALGGQYGVWHMALSGAYAINC